MALFGDLLPVLMSVGYYVPYLDFNILICTNWAISLSQLYCLLNMFGLSLRVWKWCWLCCMMFQSWVFVVVYVWVISVLSVTMAIGCVWRYFECLIWLLTQIVVILCDFLVINNILYQTYSWIWKQIFRLKSHLCLDLLPTMFQW